MTRLRGFLVDAFTVEELVILVDQWDRQIVTALPSPRGIAVQDYVHALVAEVWRHRRWTGKDGLLFHLARARVRRYREALTLAVELERVGEASSVTQVTRRAAPVRPAAPAARVLPAPVHAPQRVIVAPAVHELAEVLATPTVDLLAHVRRRLQARDDEFWILGAAAYGLLSDRPGSRLLVTFTRRRVVVDAWPHLLRDGLVLADPAVEADEPMELHYCPRGRSRRPEFRLSLAPGRCSLTGRAADVRYTLHLAASAALTRSPGES
jgi:hypothetical protein